MFSLTYGICSAGTATYSASNPACTTGVINYSPGVYQNLGDQITIDGIITQDIYENIGIAVTAPDRFPPDRTSPPTPPHPATRSPLTRAR